MKRIAALFLVTFAFAVGLCSGADTPSIVFPAETWDAPHVAEPMQDGLALWLRADKGAKSHPGGVVSQWDDRSAGGSRLGLAACPTFNAKSIGDQPGVAFSGANPLQVDLGEDWPTNEVSLFAVSQCANPKKGWNSLVFAEPDQPGVNRFLLHLPYQDGRAYWDLADNRASFRFPGGTGPQICEFTADPKTGLAMFLNGAKTASSPAKKAFDPQRKTLSIGRQFQGELSELIICKRVLEAAERERVGAYLATKYGIACDYSEDPASVPTQAAIPGLALWLRADTGIHKDADGNIWQWDDQSPSKHDAAVPGLPQLVKDGLGGKPAVRFAGGNGLQAAIPAPWPTNELSMFIVSHCAEPRGGSNQAVTTDPIENGNRFLVHLPLHNGNVYWDFGKNRTVFRLAGKTDPQLFEFTTKTNAGQTAFCGGAQMAHVASNGTFDPKDKKLIIGKDYRGEIAEVLVYHRPLSAEERRRAGFYLSQKYGLATAHTGPDAFYPVELKQTEDVAAIRATFANVDGKRRIPFRVEASADGRTWQTVVDNRLVEAAAAKPGRLRTFDSVPARHIRVVAPTTSNFTPLLAELALYRKDAAVSEPAPPPALWPDEAPERRDAAYNMYPDVYEWIVAHNQPLAKDFLASENPLREVLLPNGQMEPLWKLKQFLDFNFRIFHRPNGLTPGLTKCLQTVSGWFRNLLAHPNFYHYMMRRSTQANYDRFRRARRNIPVDSWTSGAAGVSNGSKISISKWRFHTDAACLDTLAHETGHCLRYGHDGIHTYGFGESMKAWHGQGASRYETVDPNTFPLRDYPEPFLPRLPAAALADLEPVGQLSEETFRRNLSVEGNPFSLNGVSFTAGIGLAPDTPVTYAVPSGATRFVAVAGLDDSAGTGLPAGVVLELRDATPASAPDAEPAATLIGRSPLLGGCGRRWWTFDVKLTPDVKQVRLLARSTVNKQALLPVDLCDAGFAFGPYEAAEVGAPVEPGTAACYPGTDWKMQEDGHLLAYWPDGAVRAKIAYSDGTRNGVYREFFTNGVVSLEANYVNGQLQGVRTEYDGQGNKRRREEYKEDLLKGAHQEWAASGQQVLQAEYKGGKRDGEYKVWLPGGEPVNVQQYRQGLLHGKSVWYHKNGRVSKAALYTSNVLNGAYSEWYNTGTNYIRRTYRLNRLDGKSLVWHKNGQLAEEHLYTNGVLDGAHVKYYADGKKQQAEIFAKNLLQGPRLFWYPSGKPHVGEHYRDNRLEGTRKVWHANGQLVERTTYTNGVKDGPSLTWYADGKPATEYTFAKGKLEGLQVTYYPGGQVKFKHPYRNNLLEGKALSWHTNGAKWQENDYTAGKLNGRRLEWFADGKPQFDESYANGLKEGRCIQWDAKGNVLSEKTFKNGKAE